jgi:hypothetical protein
MDWVQINPGDATDIQYHINITFIFYSLSLVSNPLVEDVPASNLFRFSGGGPGSA